MLTMDDRPLTIRVHRLSSIVYRHVYKSQRTALTPDRQLTKKLKQRRTQAHVGELTGVYLAGLLKLAIARCVVPERVDLLGHLLHRPAEQHPARADRLGDGRHIVAQHGSTEIERLGDRH